MILQEKPTGTEKPLSLAQRLAFMKLPIEERRRILSEQAERMAALYEQEPGVTDRLDWQGGDIVEP